MNIECCPACQSTNLEMMLDLGNQPLSLVAMQQIPSRSVALMRHRIRLAICHNCGHVHNIDYNPNYVKYSGGGCRMYNSGSGWQTHMEKVYETCERFPDIALAIEVGAGDCEFISTLNIPEAVKLAIDPCEAVERAEELGIQYEREYFDAEKHMPIDGDGGNTLIIMRHLLEHMTHPREMLEQIVHRARCGSGTTFLYVETPCCTNALTRSRVEDWTYEHPQHFTLHSMMRLFDGVGIPQSSVQVSYNGEVIMGVAKIEPVVTKGITASRIIAKYKFTERTLARVKEFIGENNCAFWGGSGKSSTLLNLLDLPEETIVVDSHEAKWGYCVPGTGIKMMAPLTLKKFPVDYIIATTGWRALDIRDEIVKGGTQCKALLKFENNKLVEVPLDK